jgi:hypothetical protein
VATRPRIPPQPVIGTYTSPQTGLVNSGVSGAMATSINSLPTNVQELSLGSYSMVWTGSPTGTFSIQGSNDYTQNSAGTVNAGTWDTLPVSVTVSATGSPGNGIYDIALTGILWLRLVYTASSGSGNCNAIFVGKVT